MKFVTLWHLKEHVDLTKLAEVIGRRAEYRFPPGLEPIAEYWTAQQSPAVVLVIEAENAAALMINAATWVDAFTVDVYPANSWEEGLDALGKHFAGD